MIRPTRWIFPERADDAAALALSTQLHLPLSVCRLLVARGFADPDAAKRFLRPRFEQLHSPSLMLDLDAAVDRIALAIHREEQIVLHGDYDVDGMTSTSLLYRTLRSFGARVTPFIPHRLRDGYDLGPAGVTAARDARAALVITADCGTNAHAAVDALHESHIDVIISDHHLPSRPVPGCLAVLNPRRPGCNYPDKDLAAAGVAFKLMLALAAKLGKSPGPVFAHLDLVALATVADVAPLRGENRVFVRYGLRLMAESPNTGLRALVQSAGLKDKPITPGRVGFILAPRLNAVGRLDRGLRGVELLTTDHEADAHRIARELEELNRRRQEIDRATLAHAQEKLQTLDFESTYGLVLANEGWHPGVIGIVASRLVEETGRPTVLIALDGDTGKGSGRSIPSFDLHGALTECSDLLERFGGHRAAAGVTIARRNLDAFAERFNAVARARLTPEDLKSTVYVDLEVPIDDITRDLEALLRHFEPFGMGNPAPALLARGVRLVGPARTVAQDGLKLRLATARGELDAIAWNSAHRADELSGERPIDLVFRVERDEWQGYDRLQAKVTDFHCAADPACA
ncbi:MAG TPA: single-stranded-DNA-specific exonuclease RecJ [Gemmatimonadaceae bacterium]|nr:single-stranded-DNA-specific exonuclease RecJ [Gemmatimonadaceae bacterium]